MYKVSMKILNCTYCEDTDVEVRTGCLKESNIILHTGDILIVEIMTVFYEDG